MKIECGKENKGKERRRKEKKVETLNCGLTAYEELEVGLDICPRLDLIKQVNWLGLSYGWSVVGPQMRTVLNAWLSY